LHPPLAATYRGHGSDFALVGGSIGLNVDDPRIPEAIRIAEQMGVDITFSEEDLGDVHTEHGQDRDPRQVAPGGDQRSSIGGGVIEVFKINGFQTRFKGDSPTLAPLLRDRPGMISEVTKIIAERGIKHRLALVLAQAARQGTPSLQIDVDSPMSSAAAGADSAAPRM